MVFFDLNIGTGKREIENILLIAAPCIALFFFSLDSKERKQFLIYYLIAYFVVLLGIVFLNGRSNYLTTSRAIERGINIIPFSSIKQLFNSGYGLRFALYNITGNFLMLVPLSIIIPLLFDVFKKWYKFCAIVLFFSIIIELLQYLFNIGSFDIDDIILNVLGGVVFYFLFNYSKVNTYINTIFIKSYTENSFIRCCKTIGCVFALLVFLIYIYLLVISIYNNFVDYSDLICVDNNKTYITTYYNDRFYSNCNYGNSKIKIGNVFYSIKDAVILPNIKEQDLKKMGIFKERIVNNVDIYENDLLFPDLKLKKSVFDYYYIGIDKIILYMDDTNVEMIDYMQDFKNEYNPVASLDNVNKILNNGDFTISVGEYFNVLNCSYNNHEYSFIVKSDYKYTTDFCDNMIKYVK
jgi:glycopeptide antibiotics resistance protein